MKAKSFTSEVDNRKILPRFIVLFKIVAVDEYWFSNGKHFVSSVVDSAVSAAILKQSGIPAEAVYVRTWEQEMIYRRLPWSQRFS